jgi:lysozyme family protein
LPEGVHESRSLRLPPSIPRERPNFPKGSFAMHSDFERCLANVIVSEGGFSDDAHDPGGATMNGITQAEYDDWRRHHNLARRSVRYIAKAERDSIYETEYWDKCNCDKLPAGLDYCVFDEAVNSGVARALRTLRAMKPNTPIDEEITEFNDTRMAFLKGLWTWRYFGEGWRTRVLRVEEIAKRMVAEAAEKAEKVKQAADAQIATSAANPNAGQLPGSAIPSVPGPASLLAAERTA